MCYNVRLMETIERKVVEKGAPIIIPNADKLSKEEIDRLKHNEKMRRYKARKAGKEFLTEVPKQELRKISTEEMVELSKDTRNKAIQILNKKLVELDTDPEQLNKINLATLATVFGILFDKSQLAAGLSTQNIAISAKIDVNMNSSQALEELNKMRERYQDDNKV